jgi:transposase
MEAGAGAHYWARELAQLGHAMKLIPAQYVKPYVKSNKNDANDAAAIGEAVNRPSMRFVSINTEAQQHIQMLHRVRSRLVASRTALLNQIRGLMGEYGIVFDVGPANVRRGLTTSLARADHGLAGIVPELLTDLQQQLHELDERIAAYDRRVKQVCASDERNTKLTLLPGIGPLTATAVVAAVNDGKNFPNGRQMAANLGLIRCHAGS